MRKELICYVATNEEDVEVSFQRVADDTNFVLMRLGSFAVALNRHELVEALGNLQQYGTLFDQEKEMKAKKLLVEKSRAEANARNATIEVAPVKFPKPTKPKKVAPEDEGATEIAFNNGPTASELAVEKMMADMVVKIKE